MWTRCLLGLALLCGSPAVAAPIVYVAVLDGASEAVPNASGGTGTATVTVDAVAHTMLVEVAFSGLGGPTTAAHIHCCTAVANDGTAGVATVTPTFIGFPTGVTSGVYSQLYDLTLAGSFNPAFVTNNGGTVASAEAVLLAGMAAEKTYLNIHTQLFPGGEIRGFLKVAPVPEPSTLLLSGGAILALATLRRRRLRVR